ncbi:hypothetical protein F4859DRAFT_506986 [Xylaria cf. heliscus]|nr:hypothetical protein F4859DRAFT_506986 [Xylaria cf. heliscus]
MPLSSDRPLPAMQVGNSAPDIRASATRLAYMAHDNSSSTTSSSGLFVRKESSDGVGSCLWDNIDQLSSMSNDSCAHAKKKDRETAHGSLAALQTETSKPRQADDDARITGWDDESFVNEPNGSFVGTMFDDGRSEVVPEDSVSMRDVHRKPYSTSRKTKYEDRLTRLGYVERLPDIDGKRHYRIELEIDKLIEEDKVRTELGTINLSSSPLAILNSDGLQPKLVSDLEAFNNGFLEVKSSPVSGYGAFAVRDLEPYTTILLERELFNANSFDLYEKLEALTEEQKKAYYNLYGHRRSSSEDIRAAIWRTNRFSVGLRGSVFLIASRFNHACRGRNNVDYSYDRNKRCMVFATKQKVFAGSELFIRYGGDPQHLFRTWGFCCSCGACRGISEDDCKAIEESTWGRSSDDGLGLSY